MYTNTRYYPRKNFHCNLFVLVLSLYCYSFPIILPLNFQTVTIAVYGYFGTCLLAWQYLDPSKGYEGHDVDIYVPIFGLLRFFFYIGWLKVSSMCYVFRR